VLKETLCDGRKINVDPDIIADFRKLPFPDKSFKLIVFDPPHLKRLGQNSWMAKKYGVLDKDTWKEDLRKGFSECWRVLAIHGSLIFKWSTEQKRNQYLSKKFYHFSVLNHYLDIQLQNQVEQCGVCFLNQKRKNEDC